MRQAIAVSFTLAVLVGCTSDPGNDTNSTGKSAGPNAPTLQAIGTKTIIAGDTLNFSVSASDSANRALVLTSDGSVGNGPDPYLEGAGFSSNSGTGNFTWPTNSETISYDYQIQFSATNSAGFSDSETITIRVQTNSNLYNQGRNTFTGNCVGSTCHRDEENATSRGSSVLCSSASLIKIWTDGFNPTLMPTISLSAAQVESVSYYLNNVRPNPCLGL